jgi:hypothetical protein
MAHGAVSMGQGRPINQGGAINNQMATYRRQNPLVVLHAVVLEDTGQLTIHRSMQDPHTNIYLPSGTE